MAQKHNLNAPLIKKEQALLDACQASGWSDFGGDARQGIETIQMGMRQMNAYANAIILRETERPCMTKYVQEGLMSVDAKIEQMQGYDKSASEALESLQSTCVRFNALSASRGLPPFTDDVDPRNGNQLADWTAARLYEVYTEILDKERGKEADKSFAKNIQNKKEFYDVAQPYQKVAEDFANGLGE